MRTAFLLFISLTLMACGGDDGADAGATDAGGLDSQTDAILPADAGDSGAGSPVACVGTGAPDQVSPTQDTCNDDPGIPIGAVIDDVEALTNPHHIRFPDAYCMTGEGAEGNAGITLRIQPGATRLVIFLQGGGYCGDALSCAGVRNPNGLTTVPNEILGQYAFEGGAFFRDAPFADAHKVFVHYCSGDVHAGNVSTPVSRPGSPVDGRVYTGRQNLEKFLGRLVPTFGAEGPHAVSEVLLGGSSAGAVGTLLNYERVQRAFGCTPVHAFVDSFPPMTADLLDSCIQQNWTATLNIDPSLPEGCVDCGFESGNAENILPYLLRTYPGRRFAWFTSTRDCVLNLITSNAVGECPGKPEQDGPVFQSRLEALRNELSEYPNFRSFFYPGDWHTVPIPPAGFGDEVKGPDAVSDRTLSQIEAGGTNLQDWFTDFANPSSIWSNVCEEREPRDELVTCE